MGSDIRTHEFRITELDNDGIPSAIYEIDSATAQVEKRLPQRSIPSTSLSILQKCISPFLPAGYPSTVTPDYTPYQIWDSLQAFASTIAGLLASRAVFVGMGVGSEDASLVTTMLLYIAQETIGRVATILFAHRFSQRIEAEVKFYRFFADIVNDIAFVLDCMSPAMPLFARVLTLCVSNACRAMCGVAGGSSKAILSSHFARAGNIGELNAKDGSQETVISLVGMWAGGLVVSKVHGTKATWCLLVPLLVLHLWANWQAVNSVRLKSLNHERATIFFTSFVEGRILTPDEVGESESVLRRNDRGMDIRVGLDLNSFLQFMQSSFLGESGSFREFKNVVDVFAKEDYLLWVDSKRRIGALMLKETATAETQVKGFWQLVLCLHGNLALTEDLKGKRESSFAQSEALDALVSSLHRTHEEWHKLRSQAQQVGWDLDATNLIKGHGHRIRVEIAVEDKKDK
ncbi:hypothetical protein PV08_11916 [Exophiala spinifera]|uniref:DUF647 domain-containing protein n=1 Tax=Exophiala spinifera TaxID=91928 RepID=A0A0D2ATG7_9EURO|nr:uncharacterized protein PV08_11916 [Exophiala spinifera]KIW09815.1 hypothetical protein PV08_11916 [Exophiala spinifera]